MSGMHRPVAKLAIVMSLLVSLRLSAASAAAQSLPDLFQQMKSEVNARSWDAALRTLGTLQTEAAKPGNEATREKLEGPIVFYRGVCEANLGQTDEAVENFTTFLKMQPNATIDSTVHSRQAVAAFDRARKEAADRPPSLAEAYAAFALPADAVETDPADKFWADGPVRWILSDGEKKEWASLSDANLRVAFVERFWAARAALPGAAGRSYRQEFERRVAFADAYLAHDAEQRGSLTDRGMVFILLGPPRTASRRPLRGGRSERAFGNLASRDAGGETRDEGRGSGHVVGDGGQGLALGSIPGPGASGHLHGRRIPRGLAVRPRAAPPRRSLPARRRALRDEEGSRQERPAAEHREPPCDHRGEGTGRPSGAVER